LGIPGFATVFVMGSLSDCFFSTFFGTRKNIQNRAKSTPKYARELKISHSENRAATVVIIRFLPQMTKKTCKNLAKIAQKIQFKKTVIFHQFLSIFDIFLDAENRRKNDQKKVKI